MRLQNHPLILISIVVVLIHASIIGWNLHSGRPVNISKFKEKCVVNTVAVESSETLQVESQETNSLPKKTTSSNPKPNISTQKAKSPENRSFKTVSPKQTKSVPANKLQANKPKKEPTRKQAILEKAKQNVAKLQQTRDNLKAREKSTAVDLKEVGSIKTLSFDSEAFGTEDEMYYGILVVRLKEELSLPEVGTVKIQLTIDREGNLTRLKTTETESEYNKTFLEKALKKMKFPPFGQSFKGEACHTFSITLANE